MGHKLNGKVVAAETWPDDDRGTPATRVTGVLSVRHVTGNPPETGYDQLWVAGVQVNPATVRPAPKGKAR